MAIYKCVVDLLAPQCQPYVDCNCFMHEKLQYQTQLLSQTVRLIPWWIFVAIAAAFSNSSINFYHVYDSLHWVAECTFFVAISSFTQQYLHLCIINNAQHMYNSHSKISRKRFCQMPTNKIGSTKYTFWNGENGRWRENIEK